MASVAGKTRARESAKESTHSGRLLLRMPRSLHAQLAARADDAGTSLNQYIVETLSAALAGERSPGDAAKPTPPRSLRLALVANAIVVALAAATCVALLLFAWR
jgi:hypothetical protein